MSLFEITFLGVRLWMWLYLLFSMILLGSVFLYLKREALLRKYYEIRYPERLLKVFIHYPNKMYRTFYRLIPEYDSIQIQGKPYYYKDQSLLKENDFYVFEKQDQNGELLLKIEGVEYAFDDEYSIQPKEKRKKYAEIHYFYNNPLPIHFVPDKKKIELYSKHLQDIKDNDLFTKLLILSQERKLLTFILILVGLNIIGTAFLILKYMEVI